MAEQQVQALESRLQQLEQVLQSQLSRNQQMEQALRATQAQQQADRAVADAAAAAAATAQGSGLDAQALAAAIAAALRPPQRSVVDIRGIGKPAPFKSGQEEQFRTFAQKLVAFLSAVWPKARQAMQWAADQIEPLEDDDAELEFTSGTNPDDNFPEVKDFSGQLHAALVGLVEGEGFDLVVGVEGSSGLEAWRRLTRRFDPQVIGRSKNMLKHVLNPPSCKASDMLQGLEQWEQLCRRYSSRKGPDGQKRTLPDDILMGILQEMGPQELKTHLYLNSQKFKTYADMRQEVVSFLEAKVGSKPAKDDAMDVGMMVKDGKAKSKGKGAKGKGYDGKPSPKGQGRGRGNEQKQHGKDKPAAAFEGYCSNPQCGRWGHRWKDCWKPGGGAHESKGQGGKAAPKGKKGGKRGRGANALGSADDWYQEEDQQEPEPAPAKQTCALGVGALSRPVQRSAGSTASLQHKAEQWERWT